MHSHEHHHHHQHNHVQHNLKRLRFVLILTTLYMFTEFFGGFFTNSLALMADAGHMLCDVLSLALSFGAIWLASKHAPLTKTFGYFRGEIIAALLNGLTLVAIAGVIIVEAYHRFSDIKPVSSFGMLLIAIGGFLINIIGAYILHKGSKESLNVKGAYLHVLADLMGSIGAIIAGILMYFFKWYIADPIISCIIATLVFISSFEIIKSSFNILMEGVPENIDINEVQNSLEKINGVKEVHDLHIWSLSANIISLSVHIIKAEGDYEQILSDTVKLLKEKYEISHTTIQIEPENFYEDSCVFQN